MRPFKRARTVISDAGRAVSTAVILAVLSLAVSLLALVLAVGRGSTG